MLGLGRGSAGVGRKEALEWERELWDWEGGALGLVGGSPRVGRKLLGWVGEALRSISGVGRRKYSVIA